MRRTLARRGVRAADLDDVTQEAFLAAHRHLPAFEGRSSLRTWLSAIAWRTAANYHKRSQRHHALDLSEAHALNDFRAGSSFEDGDVHGTTAPAALLSHVTAMRACLDQARCD
jgi:DNA-directed RNA polymerase specialized sigma24 family protein